MENKWQPHILGLHTFLTLHSCLHEQAHFISKENYLHGKLTQLQGENKRKGLIEIAIE